jgi:hypothetical protein
METVIRLKPSELTTDFIDKVRTLFKNDESIEISISSVSDFGLTKKEGKKAYNHRVIKAIENLERNKNTVTFSGEEFDALVNDLLVSK